jgi:hypothetical protein
MAVTFRANKSTPLTYQEMDVNLGSYFHSSSISDNGRVLYLYYTGSDNVPINQARHEVPLTAGVPKGSHGRIAYYTGSTSLQSRAGLVVDENGSVGIGVNEDADLPLTYKLEVSGSIRTSEALYQSSDERLKHNIDTIDDALTKITSSRGVTFDRNNGVFEVGVIAQEIQRTIPEVVSKDKNDYLSVNYNGIVGVLIEAIKEQDELIQNLYTRVQDLENKL